jgi:TolB-like protein/DNA-binding winged helix-turn-helix (wHTH) protein
MGDQSGGHVTLNGCAVDFAAETLRDAAGAEIPLRAQSFAVLRHLVENAGRTVSKDELNRAVWGGMAVTDDSLVQCIRDVRRALGDEAQTVVRTVPRRGYRLDPSPVVAEPRKTGGSVRPPALAVAALIALVLTVAVAVWREPSPDTGGPPSVAVLPFDDMSADGSLGYMGDGVAEDIIAMLARSPDVLVVARNSSFAYGDAPVDVRRIGAELGVDYVLEGSVRREGDKLRIVAQLNDAKTGEHVWAERFDNAGADPSALQDEVTGRIIADLAGEVGALKRAQYREAWGKDTSSLGEYDYFLRGLDVYMNADSKAEFDRAGAIFREGLAKYPDSALIKVKLAWNYWSTAWAFYSDDLTADFREADRLVSEVLARENLSPEVRRVAHWLNALVHMWRGDYPGSVREAEVAVAMAPYDARVLRYLSEVQLASGNYQTALDWLATAQARDPALPYRYNRMRGNLYRLMGRNEDALAEYAQAGQMGDYPRLVRAIVYVRLGRIEEARAEVAGVLADAPDWTQAMWREGSFYSDPAILEAEIADLARAGLPE